MRTLLLIVATLFATPALAQDDAAEAIERAFQKEYAYLAAEKAALEKRAADLERDAVRRLAEADARLAATQSRLLAMQREADALDTRLADAERAQASAEEGRGAVDGTLDLAVATLGFEAPGKEAEAQVKVAALAAAFTAASARVDEVGRVRRSTGSFYLADGKKVDGTIVQAGLVGAWGASESGSGALLPAGGGAFEVFPGDDGAVATAIAAGTPPGTVGVFLFESVEKRAEPPKAKTYEALIAAGGTIGIVILVLGAVLALLALWRVVALARGGGGSVAMAEAVALALRQGRLDDARATAAKIGGAMGRMVRQLVADPRRGREELEVLAEREIEKEAGGIDRFATFIMVGASVAPLLGLLGTVSGMIATFDVITEYGAGNPKLLSGGISEALVTTEFGLVVAIPGVLIGNLLNARAREILASTESAALLVLHHIGRARLHMLPPDVDRGPTEHVVHE